MLSKICGDPMAPYAGTAGALGGAEQPLRTTERAMHGERKRQLHIGYLLRACCARMVSAGIVTEVVLGERFRGDDLAAVVIMRS
jgi:hypothetical protein